MDKTIYLHVGYPKTGTTFLQREYFPAIEGYYYIDQVEMWRSGFLGILFDDYFATDIEKYTTILNNWKKAAGDKKLFISYEGFIGNLLNGIKNFPLICRRLKETNFEFKILLTIRRQEKIIDSLYIQYIHQGGAISFDDFIKLSTKAPLHLSLNLFDYNAIYNALMNEFGERNIFVLPYEAIRDYDDLNNFLSIFLDLKITLKTNDFKSQNVSLSRFNLKILRFSNRFFTSWVSSNGIFPSKILNTTKLKNFLQRLNSSKKNNSFFDQNKHCLSYIPRYRKSNQELQERLGIELKEEYNYL
jgi:hypothetical protein